jgi:hypothetical protein
MFLEHVPNLESMAFQYEGGWGICVTTRMDRVIPGTHIWEYFLMLFELASLILFELNSSFVIHFFNKINSISQGIKLHVMHLNRFSAFIYIGLLMIVV